MADNGLYDIYEMSHVPFWQTGIFCWLAGAALLSFFVLTVFFICRWYFKKKAQRDYWSESITRLQEIEAKLDDKQYCALFYVDITALMKKYFCIRFQINVIGKTEREFDAVIVQCMMPLDLVQSFRELLDRSTHAKFAQDYIDFEQKKRDIQLCRELLLLTRPLPENEK